MKEWTKPEIVTLGVEETQQNWCGNGNDGWTWEIHDGQGKLVHKGNLHS